VEIEEKCRKEGLQNAKSLEEGGGEEGGGRTSERPSPGPRFLQVCAKGSNKKGGGVGEEGGVEVRSVNGDGTMLI